MKDQNLRILYAGYPGKIEGKAGYWVAIPDTEESRKKALEEGYTAFSTTSFSHEPEAGKPEPIRYGSLFLDLIPSIHTIFTTEVLDQHPEFY